MGKPLLLLYIAALIFSISCLAQGRLTDHTIQVDGRARQYTLYVPTSISQNRPAPIVFVLHGGGGNGKSMAQAAPFNDFAEQDGALIVYPSGYEGFWNDGRGYQEFTSQRENVDDVGFLLSLVDRLSEEYAVDRASIFVTGFSNGGLMAHTFAARRADRIAAIAPIASAIARPVYADFQPSRPTPILILQDRNDPAVDWEGGAGGRYDWVSQPETMDRWKQVNGCGEPSSIRYEALANEPDDAPVTHMVWPDCRDGVRMEAYVIEAGLHALPPAVLDKQQRLHWQEVVWEFFFPGQ